MSLQSLQEFFRVQYGLHKPKIPILIVFILGISLIQAGISKYKKVMGLDYSLTQVLVATANLYEGHKLMKSDFAVIQLPSNHLPKDVLKPSDYLKIVGYYTINKSISRGELILWSSLNLQYRLQSPSAKIEPGYRAISIPVDSISSVSGMVLAGDHVDLISTLNIPGETNLSTLTLLQNVTVLSVGDRGQNPDDPSYATVTLMILPDEANLITHAAKYGSLFLSLRNPLDMKTNPDLNIISDEEVVQTAFRNRMQTIRDISNSTNHP